MYAMKKPIVMKEPKMGLIKRMKLAREISLNTRQISLNKIEPAYMDAIDKFGKKLSDYDKGILLKKMKSRTSFSKWPKILQRDTIQTGLGAGIMAIGGGSLASCIIGIPLSAYGAMNFVRSIAVWNYPCYFPSPVHRIFLTYPDRGSAFHEAVHFMAGEGVIRNEAAIEDIAVAASLLYDGGEGYRKRLREEGSRMNIIANLFAVSHYNALELVDTVIDIRKKSGTNAAWDYLCFLAE